MREDELRTVSGSQKQAHDWSNKNTSNSDDADDYDDDNDDVNRRRSEQKLLDLDDSSELQRRVTQLRENLSKMNLDKLGVSNMGSTRSRDEEKEYEDSDQDSSSSRGRSRNRDGPSSSSSNTATTGRSGRVSEHSYAPSARFSAVQRNVPSAVPRDRLNYNNGNVMRTDMNTVRVKNYNHDHMIAPPKVVDIAVAMEQRNVGQQQLLHSQQESLSAPSNKQHYRLHIPMDVEPRLSQESI